MRRCVQHHAEAALAAALGPAAVDLALLIPEIRERLPLLSPPAAALDPEQARFRLFDSLASFLKGEAHRAPLVVIIDDLQCADKASVLFLEFLAGHLLDRSPLPAGEHRDAGGLGSPPTASFTC